MRLDLHIHTTASDGAWEPRRVIEAAHQGSLDVISVTDHDTVDGLEEAAATAREVGLGLVPGIELSSTWEGRDVHVLGYGFDPAAHALDDYTRRAHGAREDRMAAMVGRLAEQDVRVSLDRVMEVAGGRGVVGRPHLAQVLVETGFARSVPDAFDRLIGDGHAAFVPTAMHGPGDAVDIILASGGVAVWAHPPGDLLDAVLPPLVRAGLGGLEVHRPGNGPSQTRRLLERARSAGLLVSGGSDWHDLDRNEPLGTFSVSDAEVAGLLEALG